MMLLSLVLNKVQTIINRWEWALSRYDEKLSSNNKPTEIEITQSRNLFGILEANDGSIWFGSFDGVYRYNENTIADFKGKEIQK